MSHAPYIMPDGSSLGQVLKSERRRAASKSSRGGGGAGGELTGKQAQADLVVLLTQRAKAGKAGGVYAPGSSQEQELAELRALEAVGVRRRRRWLNEKHLRDLAGPLSASDMAALYNPVPFGVLHESPLQRIREDPEAALVWESFRNIEPDKESKVLQKWEEYNRSLRTSSSATTGPDTSPAGAAAAALRRWSSVSKAARAALRKANVHSVLSLETQVLELMEQEEADACITLPLEDPFGRMLVHGLAQFHGLASNSSKQGMGGEGMGAAVTLHFRQEAGAVEGTRQAPEITCTDVLMALAEVGSSGLTHDGLSSFVRKHIHGLSSSCTSEAGDWVLV